MKSTRQLSQLTALCPNSDAQNGRESLSSYLPTSAHSPLQPEPETIQATGLPEGFLSNLTLKFLHQQGVLSGRQIAAALCLHFSGVVEPILNALRRNHMVEVKSGNHMNPASYQYLISDKGSQQAKKSAERSGYIGPCPVTLEQYARGVVNIQAQQRPEIRRAEVEHTLKDLVLPPEAIEWVGSAVLSYKSLFLYGPPGNGKTSIAKAIGQHLLNKTKYYEVPQRPYQACHARDLLDQLSDFARFRREPVRLTEELIDKAASSYFALTLPN